MASKYFVKVQSGSEIVFEGPLNVFKTKFYNYSAEWTDEDILESAREWAENNNWTFESEACH